MIKLENVKLEFSRIIKKAGTNFFFQFDCDGYWCIMQSKIPCAKTSIIMIIDWFGGVILSRSKQGYCVYSITEKFDWKGKSYYILHLSRNRRIYRFRIEQCCYSSLGRVSPFDDTHRGSELSFWNDQSMPPTIQGLISRIQEYILSDDIGIA